MTENNLPLVPCDAYSASFKTGTRTYFINLLQAPNKLKFVKITESRKIGENEYQKNRIMLFQSDIYKLAKVLQSVIDRIEPVNTTANINKLYDTWNKLKEKYPDYCILLQDDDKYFAFHSAVEYLNRLRLKDITFVQLENDLGYAWFPKAMIDKVVRYLLNSGIQACVADNADLVVRHEVDQFPNSGKKWTREDEEKLEFLFKAGKTIQDLSEIFGRKEKGIASRLQKLGLIEL